MHVYALAQRGPEKRICEDSMMVANGVLSEGAFEWEPEDDRKIVLAVADGVGGNPAGEVASFLALKGIREAEFYSGCTAEYMEKALHQINEEIVMISKSKSAYQRMAATLSGIYQDREKTLLFHVGNTRVYVMNNGKYLRQLTTDHTNVERQVELGRLTRKEAEVHPDRSQLYACLGGGDASYADVLQVMDITAPVAGERPILLSTDGLHDHVSLDEMESILAEENAISEKLEKMLQLARENGSTDDISIIYFDRSTIKEEIE